MTGNDVIQPKARRWKLTGALIGLLVGVLVAVVVGLVVAIVQGTEDRKRLEGVVAETRQLTNENRTRLKQQAAGTKAGLDILCRLKVYDLVTGSQGERHEELQGRRREALVIAGALLLVEAIPSAATCNAKRPTYPGVKTPSPRGRPLSQGQIERLIGGHIPSTDRTAPVVPVPRRTPPAPHSRLPTPKPVPPSSASPPTPAIVTTPSAASAPSPPSEEGNGNQGGNEQGDEQGHKKGPLGVPCPGLPVVEQIVCHGHGHN